MTTDELRRYEELNKGLIGKSSLLPLPFFEKIKEYPGAGWFIPFDIEVNVVNIVAHLAPCGWTPLKAEPFTKRLYAQGVLNEGGWKACSAHVWTENFSDSLPHIRPGGTCFDTFKWFPIRKQEDIKPLADYVSMICQEINLTSLLAPWTQWDERIFRFIPSQLHDFMQAHWANGQPTNATVKALYRTADLRGRDFDNLTWGM